MWFFFGHGATVIDTCAINMTTLTVGETLTCLCVCFYVVSTYEF